MLTSINRVQIAVCQIRTGDRSLIKTIFTAGASKKIFTHLNQSSSGLINETNVYLIITCQWPPAIEILNMWKLNRWWSVIPNWLWMRYATQEWHVTTFRCQIVDWFDFNYFSNWVVQFDGSVFPLSHFFSFCGYFRKWSIILCRIIKFLVRPFFLLLYVIIYLHGCHQYYI